MKYLSYSHEEVLVFTVCTLDVKVPSPSMRALYEPLPDMPTVLVKT